LIKLDVKPGDVVVTNFGIYQHWSLVTDKYCNLLKPMLISATKRNGTVQEEPWDVVTGGEYTYVVDAKHKKTITEVLRLARSQIGNWSYSVADNNCEHFVKWSTGLKISSTQVKNGVGGLALGAAIVGIVSEKPTALKFLGGALLVAGIAVAVTKAVEKKAVTI